MSGGLGPRSRGRMAHAAMLRVGAGGGRPLRGGLGV
jgi:hypothetical protein